MKYDIIIAGAGPAGIMLASDLGKDFKVLILEQGKIGTTTRSWYTFQDRIKKNKLEEAVVATPPNLLFWMDDTSYIKYKDKHALIDENKTLQIFKERAESSNCKGISGTIVKDFKYKDDSVVVKTNRGDYRGNLLIDCMGAASPIVVKRKLQQNFHIWTVYGARIKATFQNPDTIGFIRMPERYQPKKDKTNYMFGIYPKSKRHGDVYLFNYYNYIAQPELLKSMFKKSIKEHFPKYKNEGVLRGYIYNGDLKKYAFDKVVFIGDSGALTPPAIAMGFNENLRQHGKIARRIRHKMMHEKIDEHSLSDTLLDYRNSTSYTFLRIVQKMFYYGNDFQSWKEGLAVLNHSGKYFTKKWMRNELDKKLIIKGMKSVIEITGFSGLIKMMPLKEYFKVARDAAKILGSSMLEKAHSRYHKQYGLKPGELCKEVKCPYYKKK